MYGIYELEDDKEEVEGTVLGGGGVEISIMSVVYPHRIVSVSSLCNFLSVGSSSKTAHCPLYISRG